MSGFPLLDPIPLPAPVWLFKSLHLLTLSLHFVAVQVFLGSLCLAVILCFLGGSNGLRKGAVAALARRLPAVLTLVINLGVPPLLFTQVLYGPALYTSSVLIGVYWFAVIFLLMAIYWILYKFADGAVAGRNVAWLGFAALIMAYSISKIYSINMSLMLRPEVWPGMYAASSLGALLPPKDPTLMARWLMMITGSFWVAGLWMVWIGGLKNVEASLSSYLATIGSRLALVMIVVQAGIFAWVFKVQPDVVLRGIDGDMLFKFAQIGWYICAALVFIFSLWVALKKASSCWVGYLGALLTVLIVACWTILRDGIRDLTLLSKGFDVWAAPVATNWNIVGWFVLTLVLGVVVIGWLISVMLRAKPVVEGGVS